MAEDKPRLVRLTAIITQLQSKRIVTARDIAEKHQVSIRTVYRDIRTLEQSGVPIITEDGKGYTLMKGYRLPPVLFTEEEANALITAEQIIANNPDQSLIQSFNNALEKIRAVLRYSQKEKTEFLSQRLQIRNYDNTENTSQYLIKLQKAITEHLVVKLQYISQKDEPTKREIEPFALIQTRENWLLIAFCQLRSEFRVFRLDRMQQITISNITFEPHNLTLEEYFEERKKHWNCTPDMPMTQANSTFALNQKQLKMQKVKIEPFKIIGISVRTTNENGQSAKDIGALWQRFLSEKIAEKIPNKVNQNVFSIYTNYQSDHTQPYDTILGCKVNSLENIPKGMVGQSFDGGSYGKFISKGDMTKGMVYKTWVDIWDKNLDRSYTADFEVYGERAQNPEDAEVDVFVGIRNL